MDNKIQYSITIWIFLYDILFEHVVTEYSVFVISKSGNFHRKSLIGKVALNGQDKTLCSNSVFSRVNIPAVDIVIYECTHYAC